MMMPMIIDFQTEPSRYRHWRVEYDGPVASLILDVDPARGLFPGGELKLNSYDLGVDIELADAVTRLRFEHPEVRAVVIRSGKENVFCAGANIGALARASHAHKVNFCKFTNETRLAIEDASAHSGTRYLAAVNGTAAGGGYELALACDHIMLIDDRRSSVSLPEVPLLAVLPGTGGLTRLTDKRKIRRDRADMFCTAEEGVRGRRALDWRLVDELVPPSSWEERVRVRALALAEPPPLPPQFPGQARGGEGTVGNPPPLAGEGRVRAAGEGVVLPPLDRTIAGDGIAYRHVRIAFDRPARRATVTVLGPVDMQADIAGIRAAGAAFWPLAMARELDDAILHLRFNELELGLIVFRSAGDPEVVIAADSLLERHAEDWFVREVRLLLQRVFKRIDLTARSLVALIEPGSCFAGFLAELVFAADRAFMFAGISDGDNTSPVALALSPGNFGAYVMGSGLSRLATRFYGEPEILERAEAHIGERLSAEDAEELGLVTAS